MRKFLIAAAFIFAWASPGSAQVYPSRPITVVVPLPAGGAFDVPARVLAEYMRASLGRPVAVENVTGAAGSIGTGQVARAAPDGYTLIYGGLNTHVINPAFLALHYNVLSDFEPIALTTTVPLLIVAKKAMPANNLKELIAWLKANPDKASLGTGGPGNISHLTAILFQRETGTRMGFVPYRGSAAAINDLLAGHVDVLTDLASNSLPHVLAGKIKAYAVTTKDRLAAAPDIPTVDEAGLPGFYMGAYAAMLDHADQHLARLINFLRQTGTLANTLTIVTSDNGASQEGGPLGFVNSNGPRNSRDESFGEKLTRIDEIGGPRTHSNFPLGWAMAANTPLRRYKQNTHGGGIRDPLVICWPARIDARAELRHQFAHACDLTPTLLELVGIEAPAEINGVTQMPIEGTSFAPSLKDPAFPSKARPQYFEMFGHRGLWHAGWKAVAFHPPGTPYDQDKWELFHLDEDFSETNDLAAKQPDKLAALVELWWEEAGKHKVLPLDDRFRERFVVNASRFHGARKRYVFHAGMGHLPSDVAPDLRSRSYLIEAHVHADAESEGVLIAHGDATSGYSLYLQSGHLVHDMNIGGEHVLVRSHAPVPPGEHRLGIRVRRLTREPPATMSGSPRLSQFTLLIDGVPAGRTESWLGFYNLISWIGLDIGRDRGSPVSHYRSPFAFTGRLVKVTVTMDDDQVLDGDGVARAQMARE